MTAPRPQWALGLRKTPRMTASNVLTVLPIGLIHGAGQCVTVMALRGSLAFVNVVKSLEPFFNVVFGAIFMKDVLPWKVNACLLPVVAGVALASAGELDFTWDCFFFAMGSTVAFSLRGVLSKQQSAAPKGEHMDVGNTFAVVSLLACLATLPAALALEGPTLRAEWATAVAASAGSAHPERDLALRLAASGVSYYLYNEVAMYALDAVHPITHAVGNTVKRVILILFSVLAFGTSVTPQSIAGSAVAIAGVFAYSVAKTLVKPTKPHAHTA